MDEPLSVTTWPGGPVPVPELERYPDAQLEGDFIYLGDRSETAEPPPELYLRQASALDRANPGPVALEIARTVGGVFSPEDISIGDARDIAGAGEGFRGVFSQNHGRLYEPVDFAAGRGYRVHVDEIAYRLRTLYVLGRHAVAYRRGDYLAPAWQDMVIDVGGELRAVTSERDAWGMFSHFIDPALAVFHVRVLVNYADDHNLGVKGATFLEAGALQIVNDLTRDADYLICPNCGLIFARQVGQSTHYSRRTGVTYCSPGCATAARVRAYRARKRTERTS
jgi:hypothetical protein